jgi:TetR/AcrR family transcriptional regulator, transcriptional repressor for nem operon
MARPREFDEDTVINKALNVFWDKGFDAASISDLSDATGLGRASLYAAYGDKEGLFQATVAKFQNIFTDGLPSLESAPSGAAWLRNFFVRVLDNPAKGKNRGCFIQASASYCGSDRKETAAILAAAIKGTEEMLRQAVARARIEDGVDSAMSVEDITSFLMTLLHGVNAAARMGRSFEKLRRDISIGLGAIGLAA